MLRFASSRWVRHGLAALVSVAAAFAFGACGSEVVVDEGGTCSYAGETYQVGDSFPSTDGCNTCDCMEGGAVGCTERGCAETCDYQGETLQVGESRDDGCSNCLCEVGGTLACTPRACACTNDPPVCEQPGAPNCYAVAECGGDDWTCVVYCDEPCEGEPPPCAAPPEGCDYEGGGCVDGSWTCGVLVCDGECVYDGVTRAEGASFPAIDGCNVCTCGTDGAVYCTEGPCPTCDGPLPICPLGPPNCNYEVRCTGAGYTCEEYCLADDCDPSEPPLCEPIEGCETFALCDREDATWQCAYDCPDSCTDCATVDCAYCVENELGCGHCL